MKDREKTRRRLVNRLDGLRKGIDKLQEAISKFQKSEDQMQEKIIEYKTLSALGRLTANVAHEIRNPITVIGGLTERLKKSFVQEPKQKEYLDLISLEIKKLEEILKDVLIFSNKGVFKRELQDIHKIINDQVMGAVSLVEEGGVLWR